MTEQKTFSFEMLRHFCDALCLQDPTLRQIIDTYGYPKNYLRKPGFDALVRLILEQQVSLLSARAAWNKLVEKTGGVSADSVLKLSDEELRECYFSRQKAQYVKILARAVAEETIIVSELSSQEDDLIRKNLTQLKGIGIWTADSYLLLSLNRLDIFPIGDIALLNSIKKINNLPADFSKEEILEMAEKWRPYRSIATLIFWHAYIIDRKIKLDA